MITEALVLSAILFVIGTFGVLVRRNAMIMFLCIELQLNAVNPVSYTHLTLPTKA